MDRRHDRRPGFGCQHGVYRLSCEAFDAMYLAADGCCQRCGTPEAVDPEHPRRGRLVIDHDHSFDLRMVRGLLCYPCNRIMQYYDAGRRPDDVLSATYVRRYVKARQRRTREK